MWLEHIAACWSNIGQLKNLGQIDYWSGPKKQNKTKKKHIGQPLFWIERHWSETGYLINLK